MTPFILKCRDQIANDSGFPKGVKYDRVLQLWVHEDTGQPFVSATRERLQGSTYGETSITESREGADQSEIATLQASTYGETALTKTLEGADQPEGALTASTYGETTVTATSEGHDQREIASVTEVGFNAPYSHF